VLSVEPENAASRVVAEACGFIEDGKLRPHMEHDGQRYEPILYGLLLGELR
jgi:RimJ/RimL family protein N-acetyltransferase